MTRETVNKLLEQNLPSIKEHLNKSIEFLKGKEAEIIMKHTEVADNKISARRIAYSYLCMDDDRRWYDVQYDLIITIEESNTPRVN